MARSKDEPKEVHRATITLPGGIAFPLVFEGPRSYAETMVEKYLSVLHILGPKVEWLPDDSTPLEETH